MKILYLHQHFATPAMSGGSFSYEWARRLVEHGHQVHMVTAERSGQGRGWSHTLEDGIDVHRYPSAYSNKMGYRRRIRAFLEFAYAAAHRAASLPGDLVIATSTPLTMALPGVYASQRQRIPMVFEIADLWPEIPIALGALRSPATIAAARWLERFAYRNAAHVIAQSPGIKDAVVAAGYPVDQITVIPCSCDRQRFDVPEELGQQFRAQFPWLGPRPLVVYTGSIGPINGLEWLARLAAAVGRRDPRVRFVVVGGGREEPNVRRAANELGVLDRNFFMLPPIPKRDVPAVLSAADIAASVFIDLKEMWTNNATKVFDAFAAGRPVAINHQGWLADLIRRTNCGLVLDVQDVESSATRLVAALADRPWQQRARTAAARLALERFDRDKMAARFESVLERVLETRTRRMAA